MKRKANGLKDQTITANATHRGARQGKAVSGVGTRHEIYNKSRIS